jgi:hypothetical protein
MVKAKKKGAAPKGGKVQADEDDSDWEAMLEAEGVRNTATQGVVVAASSEPSIAAKPPATTVDVDGDGDANTAKTNGTTGAASMASQPPLDAAAAFLAAQGITAGGNDEDKKDSKKKKKKKPAGGEKKVEAEKPEKV